MLKCVTEVITCIPRGKRRGRNVTKIVTFTKIFALGYVARNIATQRDT